MKKNNKWTVSNNTICINKRKYKKYLLICERDVIWVGHEEEVCSYFGERKEPVETFDYEECKKYLIELLGERREFVKKVMFYAKKIW